MFDELGIEFIHHYSPLHYFPFIARSLSLKSKIALRDLGFEEQHFRSKSKRSDERRGFGEFAFLTIERDPRIVKAKLAGGFPHFELIIPVDALKDIEFDLCRFNVAMTRRLKENGKSGWPESNTNGRYYEGKLVPIARTDSDKRDLVAEHYPKGTMIEVLVKQEFFLPDDTQVVCFHDEDLEIVGRVTEAIECQWDIFSRPRPGTYFRKKRYVNEVKNFVERSLESPRWRGNGLEFDRV